MEVMKKNILLISLCIIANFSFAQMHIPTKVKDIKVPENAKLLSNNIEKPEIYMGKADSMLYKYLKNNENSVYSLKMPIEDVLSFYFSYLKFNPSSLCAEDSMLVSEFTNTFDDNGKYREEEEGVHFIEMQITYYNMLKDKQKADLGKELKNQKSRKLVCDKDLIYSAMIIVRNPIKGYDGQEKYDMEISIKDKSTKDAKGKYIPKTEIFIGGYGITE
ncbi:MAG: hypothetical protein A2X12_11085 [Bacteroidetes bacterium GWE2_29_8]|nr:MAG: hypothetical protein A2X12_11085 [Bacteroidetes bacterium GWE2_29_8]OFY22324.1 MAG: hypothetical protein A2X02_07565 [Bacteroidetes bacterium GWF2_29_10]